MLGVKGGADLELGPVPGLTKILKIQSLCSKLAYFLEICTRT